MIDFNNYFHNTIANFKGCKKPKRKPDYVSKSGSKYWYGENKRGKYVIRHSDHWCNVFLAADKIRECSNIASCYWSIKQKEKPDRYFLTGKQYLINFRVKK